MRGGLRLTVAVLTAGLVLGPAPLAAQSAPALRRRARGARVGNWDGELTSVDGYAGRSTEELRRSDGQVLLRELIVNRNGYPNRGTRRSDLVAIQTVIK